MKWRRTRNRILKGVTALAVIVGILSIIALDGDNVIIPVIALTICVGWGVLFGVANTK